MRFGGTAGANGGMAASSPTPNIGELNKARAAGLGAARAASMSERLARVHALCKQMSAIKGAAGTR